MAINNQTGLFHVIIGNLEENSYIFQVVSFDGFGNRSLPFEASGRVYGSRYEEMQITIEARQLYYNDNGLTIVWVGSRENAVANELEYTDRAGGKHLLLISLDTTVTQITDWKEASSIRYRTLYQPDVTAIDTFAARWIELERIELRNRGIRLSTKFGNGLLLVWSGQLGDRCELTYTDVNDEQKTLSVPVSEDRTFIPGFKSGLTYSTFYMSKQSDAVSISPARDISATIKPNERIEMKIVDFDYGGDGVGYHDTDGGNSAYREALGDPNCGVDLEGSIPSIGYINAGEWLQHTVYVEKEGDYIFDALLSVNGGEAKYSLIVNGEKTEVYILRNNNNWSDWRWYHATFPDDPSPTIHLKQGANVIRYYVDGGGFNLAGISFVSAN